MPALYHLIRMSNFFKNGTTPASILFFVKSFQTQITIFTKNKSEKMSLQSTLPGIELTTFGT